MIYKSFKELKLSSLGMGCMRLPLCKDDTQKIDREAVSEMVKYAMENGINYYDTAWGYHNGESEIVMGETLKAYPRDSFCLASKFPGYDLNNMDKAEEIFEKQLQKCQVEYFDFYLIHNVCEMNIDAYLDPKFGILDYFVKQKKAGRIRHLGFSNHGSLETVKRFLEVYGGEMEFCQIQLNWIDWKLQNAKALVELLRERNLPIWVMEPVRGGKLASLEKEYEDKLKEYRPDSKAVEWAFRFIQTVPEVVVTLSGMSDFNQLKENIDIFKEEKPLDDNELTALFDVAEAITSKTTLPCTACRYCTPYCPMELEIPQIIEIYNEHVYSDGDYHSTMAANALPEDKKPSVCIGCRACEAVCPQSIKISEMMADFVKRLKK